MKINLTKGRITKFSIIAVIMVASLFAGMMIEAQSAPLQIQVNSAKAVSYQVPNIIGTVNVVVRDGKTGQILCNEISTHLDPLTQTGSSYIISQLGNTSEFAAGAGTNLATNLCLSNDSTPLVTWTALPTLINANGLSPANVTATYGWCTTASGLSQYMIETHTWTCATGNENGVQCVGICYVAACTSGLICANTFSPACNLGYANSDTIQVTYNVTMPCG